MAARARRLARVKTRAWIETTHALSEFAPADVVSLGLKPGRGLKHRSPQWRQSTPIVSLGLKPGRGLKLDASDGIPCNPPSRSG
ncbi:hypothetical protein THIX_60896 [Thiomonas sp. X19]|nr:hypothetical protein THIX_60896 [Thiomonas sp. X19]